jgi:KUP system potassium uptake protein
VPGSAVFFTRHPEETPQALQQLARTTGVMHETVILTTVVIEPVPIVGATERIELTELDSGFYSLVLRYGFMQGPNVPSDLSRCADLGLELEMDQIRYIVGHTDLLAGRKMHGMVAWRDQLFVRMAINTQDTTSSYQIPVAQTMKVGLQIGI